MPRLALTKCHGAGNDFIIIDAPDTDGLALPALAKTLCDRHRSVGADGLLVLDRPRRAGADLLMRIFNADGSEAEMCGNGIRCVARYRYEKSGGKDVTLAVDTVARIVRTQVVRTAPSFSVRVDMGIPESVRPRGDRALGGFVISRADVSFGNPHSVVFVDIDPSAVDAGAIAAELATSDNEGATNVEIARTDGGKIEMRVIERGVGETLACGSGACAAAAAAIVLRKAASPLTVSMRGGDVVIEWPDATQPLYMTGGAELVFTTQIDVPAIPAAPSPASV